MFEHFNPRYELPSRHYFSREAIPSLYAETRRTIEQFRNIKDFIILVPQISGVPQ